MKEKHLEKLLGTACPSPSIASAEAAVYQQQGVG